jgi:hypothetical protein
MSLLENNRQHSDDVSGVVDASMGSPFEGQIVFLESLSETLASFEAVPIGVSFLQIDVSVSERPVDVVECAVSLELPTVVLAPRAENGVGKIHHPGSQLRHCFGKANGGINIFLLNPRQLAAECGQHSMPVGSNKGLKFVDRLQCPAVRNDRADFDDLHFLAGKLTVVAARCFEVDDQPEVGWFLRDVGHGSAVFIS